MQSRKEKRLLEESLREVLERVNEPTYSEANKNHFIWSIMQSRLIPYIWFPKKLSFSILLMSLLPKLTTWKKIQNQTEEADD